MSWLKNLITTDLRLSGPFMALPILLVFLTPLTSLAQLLPVPQSLTIQGRILDTQNPANPLPIEEPDVSFRVQILSPNNCLLYEELKAPQDMSGSGGVFALQIGPLGEAGLPFSDLSGALLAEAGVALPGLSCRSGDLWEAGSYTPALGDIRKALISFKIGAGDWVVLEGTNQLVQSAPYSLHSATLQGYQPGDFVQVTDPGTTQTRFNELLGEDPTHGYMALRSLLGQVGSGGTFSPSGNVVLSGGSTVTGLPAPAAADHAVSKGYADARLAGKELSATGFEPGPAADGKAITWNNAQSKWVLSSVSPDLTSVVLRDGSQAMTGDLNMGGKDILSAGNIVGTGHITMSQQKTLTFGSLTDTQETTLISTLGAVNAGATWFNSTLGKIRYWDGTIERSLDTGGGTPPDATDVSKGVVQIGDGLAVVAGLVSIGTDGVTEVKIADNAVTNVKLAAGIDAAKITGDISGSAAGFTGALAGDVTGTQGATSVVAIRGRGVAASAVAEGQVYLMDGANTFQPAYLSFADLKTSGGIPQLPGSCAADQTLVWSSVTDTFSCSAIAISTGRVTDFASEVNALADARIAATSGAASGVASLDGSSLVPVAQIPNLDAAKITTGSFGNAQLSGIAVNKIESGAGLYLNYSPNATACNVGEVLKWTGDNRWECGVDAGSAGTVASVGVTAPIQNTGDATNVVLGITAGGIGDALLATGIDAAKISGNITGNAAGFTGALAGDVTGNQGTTSVVALRGQALHTVAPTNGQALIWNNADSRWEAQALPSAPVTSVAGKTGVVALEAADITDFNAAADGRADGRISAARGAANGIASLDASSLVPVAQIPDLDAAKITAGTLPATRGGTGLGALGTANQILGINNDADSMEYKSLSAGSGVTISHSAGGIEISAAGSGGTVTSVTAGTGLDGGTITGTGTIDIATGGVTATQLATDAVTTIKIEDGAVTNAKLATGIDAAKISGNITGNAAGFTGALAGDVTGNQGTTSVVALRGRSVAASAVAEGQVYRMDGANTFQPAYLSFADLKTSVGTQQLPGSCTAGQTLVWSSVTDTFSCSNIAVAYTQVSGLGSMATQNSDTYLSKTGGTMTGQLVVNGGFVGIGTSTPAVHLDVAGPIKVGANDGLDCNFSFEGAIRIRFGNLEYCNGSGWTTLSAAGGSGILSLNGLIDSAQNFGPPGISGTSPNWLSSPGTHTLNIPMASGAGVTAGLISKTDHDFFSAKLSTVPGSPLQNGQIFVGDGANQAQARVISGDATLSNAGALTINTGAITTAKIANGAITDAKIDETIGISANKVKGGTLSLAVMPAFNGDVESNPGSGYMIVKGIYDKPIHGFPVVSPAEPEDRVQLRWNEYHQRWDATTQVIPITVLDTMIYPDKSGTRFEYNNTSLEGGTIRVYSYTYPIGFEFTVARIVPRRVEIKLPTGHIFDNGLNNLEMTARNLASVTIAYSGSGKWRITQETQDCVVGESCWHPQHIYLGTYRGYQYFTTPGGCTTSTYCPDLEPGSIDSTTKFWGNHSVTNVSFIDGKQQSQEISSFAPDSAARFCEDMNIATYADWYLPAQMELDFLLRQAANIQSNSGIVYDTTTSGRYWSSTQHDASNARWIGPALMQYAMIGKTTASYYVRCIRRI